LKIFFLIFVVLLPGWIFGQSNDKVFSPMLKETEIPPAKKDVWFGEDKAKHVVASFVLTGAAAYYCRHRQKWSDEKGAAFGAGFTFSMGIAKEIGDLRSDDPFFSWKDLVADLVGIGLGVVFLSWW
jgi:uncharacterized protein YfiM (DUF2279 family)